MFSLTPSYIMFYSSLILSTVWAMSATNWLILWVALEVNLMSFIPIILKDSTLKQTEAAIKYFLAQSIGSSILLASTILILNSVPNQLMSLNIFLMMSGLMLKLGAPPMHFWFPQVMQGISWTNCIILSCWQKLAPIFIMFSIIHSMNPHYLIFVTILMAMTGSAGGLNQNQLRPLLAFSSISHMSWMLAASAYSLLTSSIYLLIYITITTSIMLMMNKMNTMSTMNMVYNKLANPTMSFASMTLLLSLGGLPPLLGFFPKWMTMELLIYENHLSLTLMLLASALINLFFYLRLSFNMIMNPSFKIFKMTKLSHFMLMTSYSTLPVAPMLMFILMYAMNLFNKS